MNFTGFNGVAAVVVVQFGLKFHRNNDPLTTGADCGGCCFCGTLGGFTGTQLVWTCWKVAWKKSRNFYVNIYASGFGVGFGTRINWFRFFRVFGQAKKPKPRKNTKNSTLYNFNANFLPFFKVIQKTAKNCIKLAKIQKIKWLILNNVV